MSPHGAIVECALFSTSLCHSPASVHYERNVNIVIPSSRMLDLNPNKPVIISVDVRDTSVIHFCHVVQA